MIINLEAAILLAVEKPARYTGHELNAVHKDWDSVPCHFALALSDIYEVGMSNLGLKILYEVLNSRQDTACERVYAPWVDMEAIMRERQIPLFSLESFHAVKDFDFLGFSLQYEMIYSNILNMLDLAGCGFLCLLKPGCRRGSHRRGGMPFQPVAAGGTSRGTKGLFEACSRAGWHLCAVLLPCGVQ